MIYDQQIKLINLQNLLNKYKAKILIRIKDDDIVKNQDQQYKIFQNEQFNESKILEFLNCFQQNNQLYKTQKYLERILEKYSYSLKLINSAKQCFLQKQYQIAMNLYDQYNLLNPYDHELKLDKAICLYKLKQYKQAYELLKDLQQINENKIQIKYYIANIYKANQNYVDAINLYDKILEIKPQDTKSIYKKARIYSINKQKEENDTYNKILRYEPRNIKIFILKTFWCYKNQQYSEGLLLTEKYIEFNSQHFIVHYNKGLLLEQLGKSVEAMQCYDKAIQLNPTYANAYNNKGVLLEKLRQPVEAMQCYDIAIQLNPTYANAYNNKGFLFQQLGKSVEAMKSFDKAIQLNHIYAIAYQNKGLLLEQLGKSVEAICYDKAIQLQQSIVISQDLIMIQSIHQFIIIKATQIIHFYIKSQPIWNPNQQPNQINHWLVKVSIKSKSIKLEI